MKDRKYILIAPRQAEHSEKKSGPLMAVEEGKLSGEFAGKKNVCMAYGYYQVNQTIPNPVSEILKSCITIAATGLM